MEKTYDSYLIENRWMQFWQTHHFYEPTSNGEPYCIMLPPPNVTGTLHMGHGFQHSLMDALIRRQRMLGKNTLWQPGTDHAGIATQMVVERQLGRQGITRQQLGREKFIEKVWEWREHSGNTIVNQIKRLGNSLAWSQERYSMDEPMSNATIEAFIRLYDEGLVYKGKRLVNWDPALQTAISDLEVTTETTKGHLWYIRYPLAKCEGHVIVATTRPETLFGDMAIAVNPLDQRFQHLIGQLVKLPLTNRTIPIIADPAVSSEFGTGCVKVTPAHDFNDYEMGKRHQLEMINIFTLEATLNENVPSPYQSLDRYQARKQVIAELEKINLLEKIEDYQINVPKGDRSGVVIEPLLTDQWYIKMQPLAKPAIQVAEQNKIRFIPENWQKTYLQWLENIQDWCISRQLWWGHQIPAWYDSDKNIYVGLSEEAVRKKYQLSEHIILTQDPDVLDTWFTASIYPFATLGWPDKTPNLSTFYPTDVLVTGFDIIFFWVARMVMMGLKLAGDIPFLQIYITGLIRDSQGQKMSKTKGNILDPLDLIHGIDLQALIKKRTADLIHPQMAEKIATTTTKEFPNGIDSFGADALRFTFCALANTGRDINFDIGRIAGYRNFCNKLWNAARFVLMNLKTQSLSPKKSDLIPDRWIKSLLQKTIKQINESFEQYRFDLIAQNIYEFSWNEYCDWYLELAKCILSDPNLSSEQRQATESTLVHTLETMLRLLHPLMPFITEEIWQSLKEICQKNEISIMVSPYPILKEDEIDNEAENIMNWFKGVTSAIRNLRSENGISPAKKITIICSQGSEEDKKYLEVYQHYLKALARIDEIIYSEIASQESGRSSTTLVNQLIINIPLTGLVDKNIELERLKKEINKLVKEHDQCKDRLNNLHYLEKAPASVVEKEKERFHQTKAALEKLQQNYKEYSNS